jgi:hypothetical protein
MLGQMMDALGRYCSEFPHERNWRDRLVALANATAADLPERKYKVEWLDVSNCNGFAYAYLFSGRDRFLDLAARLMDQKGLLPGDKTWPRYRTGTGAGKYWSEFGHRLSQTMMWARWHRGRHGTPAPPTAIRDLAAAAADDGGLQLSWTAPAWEGKPADAYFVKVAALPFKDDLKTAAEGKTAANWWMTPIVEGLTASPQAPGRKQTVRIAIPDRLAKATALYVAVRSVKQVGPVTAVSDLSNVVQFRPRR